MGAEVFQLTTAVRVLADDVELAEALGFPEISALGDAERRWQAALTAKGKAILEDHALSPVLALHRRRLAAKPEARDVEITVEPPKRSPEWQEPVRLRLPVLCWVEAGDLHQAYVPALGILVFASRESLLDERVKEHVRLILMGRRKKVGLLDLAKLARIQSLKIGSLTVTAKIATPKEIAVSLASKKEKSSMLELLAEELPPHIPRTDDGEDRGVKAPPRKEVAGFLPLAFEMKVE